MTTSTSSSPSSSSSSSVSTGPSSSGDLVSSKGRTSIADSVVQKIAGIAAREVSGIYSLGGGASRAFGALKERVGSTGPNVTSGVSVEVGERQAAVDLNCVVEYGVAIADLAESVRRNVVSSVERMTGLQVTEVNVTVDDVHLPGSDDDQDSERQQQQQREPARVQ